MRITTLCLKNFRCHVETKLELDKFNFVRGPNGCGKSSIQMALEYLFTGRCELTDAAGRGAEALIRAGQKELEVSATLVSGETICRRRTAKAHIVEINGRRVPVDAAEAYLGKQFGSPDVLSAILNSGRFIEMPESEQKRFLAHVVDAGKVDLCNEIIETLRAMNEEPPKLVSVSDAEVAYKRFCGMRTETICALTALGHLENPDIPSDLPSVYEVRTKLEDLRQQKEKLVAQKAEAGCRWEGAQERLKQVQAEIEATSSELLNPSQEQVLLRLESQRGDAEKLRQELADLIAEQKAVETALAAFQSLKGKCTTCSRAISEEVKAKKLRSLQERLTDLEGRVQGAREELIEIAGIEAARSRLEQHRKALARSATLEGDRSKLQAVQRPDVEVLDSRMAILVERINKAERVLEKAQQLESAKERWESQVRDQSSLEARMAHLDRLIEFFDPNGAVMGPASGRMGSFTESLNRHLAAFGYNCKLALAPFEVCLGSSGDNPSSMPLKHLSESEQLRFGVAFQVALAMVTGLGFVVIDQADQLDNESRKMLTCLLVNSELDQAVVLATSRDPAPSLVPRGVRFLDLGESNGARGLFQGGNRTSGSTSEPLEWVRT